MAKAYQERLVTLLKDTITLLCKNGLEYSQEFCVEGLLGVTLDKDEVFLIPIKELVADKGVGTSDNQDGQSHETYQVDHELSSGLSPKRERKKKRRHAESTNAVEVTIDSPSIEWHNDTNDPLTDQVNLDNNVAVDEPPTSKRRHRDENGDDLRRVKEEEVVVIKEEVDDVEFASAFHDNSLDDSQTDAGDSSMAYFSQPGTSQGGRLNYQMDQLVGGSIMASAVPGSGIPGIPPGGEGDVSWDMSQSNASGSQADWQQNQKHQWDCATCGKMFDRRSWLKRHIDSVHLRLRPAACDLCGKLYSSTGNLNAHKRMVHLDEITNAESTFDSISHMYPTETNESS